MGFNGGESNRGLTRLWSAPSTWLDTLIQPDEDGGGEGTTTTNSIPQPPPQPPPPPQIPTLSRNNSASINYIASSAAAASPVTAAFFDNTGGGGGGGGDLGFLRQNSSPAELLARLTSLPASLGSSDGFLSSYGGSGNYDYNLSSCLDFPSNNKRPRDSDFQQEPPKISPHQPKGEQSGGDYGDFGGMEMEKLFEDGVPCGVRAKRGCATHPRSIAERVRRTRISDRIRKLQELVPNMDKQTNTADMLEEAVEYVKHLQKQIQELSEHRQNCKCLVRG